MPQLKTAPGFKFIQGSVESIDAESKTATITKFVPAGSPKKVVEEKYDYLVVATGLRRVWPTVPESLTREAYLSECYTHLDAVEKAEKGVTIIGGGAVGIELAGELKHVHPELKVNLLHSRSRLLSSEPLPDEFASVALDLLNKTGVETKLGCRVLESKQISQSPPLFELTLCTGEKIETSNVMWAISRQHATGSIFLPQKAVDEQGYVRISANCAIENLPAGHFCAGDVVKWSGIRRAGTAMYMGNIAAQNVFSRILASRGERKEGEKRDLELPEIPPMMGLAVGDEAVAYGEAEGVKSGKDIMKLMFEDDLGWGICWRYMKLGEEFKA